jgi:hypothetical protein
VQLPQAPLRYALGAALIALLPLACAGRGQVGPATTSPALADRQAPPETPTTSLPGAWDTTGVVGFAERLKTWRGSAPNSLPHADRRALAAALAERDALSVRAVLLLADTDAGHLDLIQHLEARVEASTRALDASDVVAAAALTAERRGEIPERLLVLALRGTPHPDIEVRVECARAALASGMTEVIPFLLTVLRVGTRDEQLDPPDWPASATLAWIKSRAAEALCRHAGVAVAFRPDGSFEHQEQEARRLAELLIEAR